MEEKRPKYSDKEAERIGHLLGGFIRDTLTREQRLELDDWLEESEDNMQLFLKITDEQNVDAAMKLMGQVNTEKALANAKEKISFNKRSSRLRSIRLWQGIAAACIIIIFTVLYFMKAGDQDRKPNLTDVAKNDLIPGTNKATLTLEDGKVINLDAGAPDTSLGDKLNIFQKKGEVYYNSSNSLSNTNIYHTLNVPRGGQYKLILPDGTKVWLNAASSIRYPVAFNGDERRVFVTGETFFEVAKDKTKPFRVVADSITVEALGTKFNVNIYDNEPDQSATLVEGSVLVTKGEKKTVLKPGEQIHSLNKGFAIENPEMDDIIAWTDNEFKYTDAPLDVIMRDVERWYDAEVVYETSSTEQFTANMSRDLPLSKLLYVLELTKRVHFRIENKRITVIK